MTSWRSWILVKCAKSKTNVFSRPSWNNPSIARGRISSEAENKEKVSCLHNGTKTKWATVHCGMTLNLRFPQFNLGKNCLCGASLFISRLTRVRPMTYGFNVFWAINFVLLINEIKSEWWRGIQMFHSFLESEYWKTKISLLTLSHSFSDMHKYKACWIHYAIHWYQENHGPVHYG